MKKTFILTSMAILCICQVHGQIKTVKQTSVPTTIKMANPNVAKTYKTSPVVPGAFNETTPVVLAPDDATKNTATLHLNSVAGALDDDATTKYYFFDCNKNGKDKLLAIKTNTTSNSLRRIDLNASGSVYQAGGFQFNPAITSYDELLFGEFSPESGATVLVVDRRANQFWHYQHNPSNLMVFERPYSMLSNWPVADRYLTGDFNGDGKTDLLGWNFAKNEFQVALHTKNTQAALGPASLQPAGVWLSGWAQTAGMNMVTGDFNGDKKDDIAVVHQASGEWWVALSTGTGFQASTGYKSGVWLKPWAVGAHQKITAIDVNNDGKCDLVAYDPNEKSFQAASSNGQYFDYLFKKEMIRSSITNPEQVVIGKLQGACMIAVGHLLPPDARYVASRRAVSVYLTNYQR